MILYIIYFLLSPILWILTCTASLFHNKIKIWGLPAMTGYTIEGDNKNYLKTYITQEMLKKGFITGNCIYLSISHNKKILNKYFSILDKILMKIKQRGKLNNIKKLLDGPVSHATFRRLN